MAILYIIIFAWVIKFSYDCLGNTVFWLYGIGGSFGLMLASGDGAYLIIAFACVIGFFAHLSNATNESQERQQRDRAIQRNRREEKYDNEWGIIDFKEK